MTFRKQLESRGFPQKMDAILRYYVGLRRVNDRSRIRLRLPRVVLENLPESYQADLNAFLGEPPGIGLSGGGR